MINTVIYYTGRPSGYKKRRNLHRFAKKIDKKVAGSQLELSPDGWYSAWHQHLDWDNLGQESQKWRRFFAERFYRLMKKYDSQLKESSMDSQLWMMFDLDKAGYDAVFINTPNPHCEYPLKIAVAGILDSKQVPEELRCDCPMHYSMTRDRKILCQFPNQAESNKSIQADGFATADL